VLPVPALARFGGRILSALAFGLASAATVVVVAVATTSVALSGRGWALFVLAIAVGSVPFALFGIALGYWLTPRGALPTANILFLGLSYAGGLLSGGGGVPDSLATLSRYLPTRLWGNLLSAAVEGRGWRAVDVLGLAVYATLFAAAATVGYRRDEGERFR
jgi:ABC-2 type transport system permease protein